MTIREDSQQLRQVILEVLGDETLNAKEIYDRIETRFCFKAFLYHLKRMRKQNFIKMTGSLRGAKYKVIPQPVVDVVVEKRIRVLETQVRALMATLAASGRQMEKFAMID